MKPMEGENIIHELRPARNLLVIWFFTKCLPLGFIGLAVTPVFGILESIERLDKSKIVFLIVVCVALILAGIILGLVYYIFLRRTYIYYITNKRCVFHGGIIRRVERSVPYHKITDVEMSQHIVERILRISKLNIFTPSTGSMSPGQIGGQRAELSFVGLKDNETPVTTINEILRTFRATGE